MRVTAAGTGTLVDEIERLLDKAVAAKSRYVRLADRAARLYAPVVHRHRRADAASAGSSPAPRLHDAIVTAIAVLIITCPCALALAIPAVQVVASGALFRAGLILNAGDAIERLAEVDTVVFDKTGTLTLPEPRVDNAAGDRPGHARTRRAAGAVEPPSARWRGCRARRACACPTTAPSRSRGKAFARIDRRRPRRGSAARRSAADRTPAPLAPDDTAASIIAFSHAGRGVRARRAAGAAAGCGRTLYSALHALGLELAILSGDRAERGRAGRASSSASPTGAAASKPAEKIAAIEALKQQGRRVLMVGDGINDAPALAAAHVSLSPISAAHVTQAHADARVPRRAARAGARRGRDLRAARAR